MKQRTGYLPPRADDEDFDGASSSFVAVPRDLPSTPHYPISLSASVTGDHIWDSQPATSAPARKSAREGSATPTSSDNSDSSVDTLERRPESTLKEPVLVTPDAGCSTCGPLEPAPVQPHRRLRVIVFLALLSVILRYYSFLPQFCALPGVREGFSACSAFPKNGGGSVQSPQADFPGLMRLQAHLEEVVENSVGGIETAHGLKKSRIAVYDLNSLVKYSDLHCREELSNRLERFAVSAKATSRQLSQFHSGVTSVVDNIISLGDSTLRHLLELDAERRAISSLPGLQALVPSIFRAPYDDAAARQELYATFLRVSTTTERAIRGLLEEADVPIQKLDDLEQQLRVMAEVVARETGVVMGKKKQQEEEDADIFVLLWKLLSGSGNNVDFEEHRKLLSEVATYKTKAMELVSVTMLRLEDMESKLESFRNRLAEPILLAGAGESVRQISMEEQMQSLREGMASLSGTLARVKSRENAYMNTIQNAHHWQERNY